jgi:hypothetical protein
VDVGEDVVVARVLERAREHARVVEVVEGDGAVALEAEVDLSKVKGIRDMRSRKKRRRTRLKYWPIIGAAGREKLRENEYSIAAKAKSDDSRTINQHERTYNPDNEAQRSGETL